MNNFSGPIPDSGWDNIEAVHFTGNYFTGTIPPAIIQPSLQYLELASNKLIGTIPELKTATMVEHIQVGNNMLTGSIAPLHALKDGTWVGFEKNL